MCIWFVSCIQHHCIPTVGAGTGCCVTSGLAQDSESYQAYSPSSQSRPCSADGIDQPHDDILDFPRFSVRVAQKDIPKLPQILAGISMRERAELQRGLIAFHRAFMWGPAPFDERRPSPNARGLAYNYTIESLRRSYRMFVIEKTLVSQTTVQPPGSKEVR